MTAAMVDQQALR